MHYSTLRNKILFFFNTLLFPRLNTLPNLTLEIKQKSFFGATWSCFVPTSILFFTANVWKQILCLSASNIRQWAYPLMSPDWCLPHLFSRNHQHLHVDFFFLISDSWFHIFHWRSEWCGSGIRTMIELAVMFVFRALLNTCLLPNYVVTWLWAVS